MQRSDVLTGLSIRLGPALKIYERHVKVLQRTHFLEYEDIWSVYRLGRKCRIDSNMHAVPHPYGSYRPPSYTLYVEGVWRGGAAVEFTFTVRMTRNWKSVILPLIVVFGIQMVFISPLWPHCGQNRLQGKYVFKWSSSDLPTFVKHWVMQPVKGAEPCSKWTTIDMTAWCCGTRSSLLPVPSVLKVTLT